MNRAAQFCCMMFAAAMLFATPASADLRVCDRTSYIVTAAVGYESGTQMLTRGWTRIVPGDCAVVLEGSLGQPAYFLYARSSRAHAGPAHAWGGRIRLCAKETNFAIDVPVGSARCGSDDAFLVPFAAVATGHKAAWTITLRGERHFANAAAASAAGEARLLGDIGYRVGLGDPAGDAKALADFQRRAHLPAHASDTQIFAALETAAQKAAAPEGYSVCNDGRSEFWAAIALPAAKEGAVKGWWDVPPGACAKLLTTALKSEIVYLLAQDRSGRKIVSGPVKFCVANTAFETSADPACEKRGLTAAGFAATNTKGRSGLVADIGDAGLVASAPK